MKQGTFFKKLGGRKQFNGYLYALLLTVMVFLLDGTFETYALWLAGALLGTSAIVAYEDSRRTERGSRRGRYYSSPMEREIMEEEGGP